LGMQFISAASIGLLFCCYSGSLQVVEKKISFLSTSE